MIVIKKVNNNVAVCRDGSGRELIAFGKGIGFPAIPYEITDLNRIDRTFYDIGEQFLPLLNDLPAEVLEFTAREVDRIRPHLSYETSTSLVFTLADHIAFSMERSRKGIYVRMPSIYNMQQEYPLEVKVAKRIVRDLEKSFHLRMPKGEVQGIAMHFINARNMPTKKRPNWDEFLQSHYEEILEETTCIIEREMHTSVKRDSFNYARYATHLEYLLKRICKAEAISSDNESIYQNLRQEYPEVTACVDRIAEYYNEKWQSPLSDEEKLYLILHTNRVCAAENE